jgi:MHS family alpha-ketoglutarate permease-like MFS transporter
LLIVSGYTSINAIVKAELFPGKIRALGVGLPYAVTAALYLAAQPNMLRFGLRKAGHETYFFWYVTGCIFISLVVYAWMKDTRQTSLIKEE